MTKMRYKVTLTCYKYGKLMFNVYTNNNNSYNLVLY